MTNTESKENKCLTTNNVVKVVEQNKNELNKNVINVKVYKKRWIMLALFMMSCGANTLPFVQYSIISNIITRYYGVSATAVDWTAMIYMLSYIPLVAPLTHIFEKKGLRWSTILSTCCTCLGAWIKIFSVSSDRFYVAFIGQFVVASMQVYVLSSPSRLAAQWFNSEQVSTATSLGIFGTLLGIALGFLIPPIMVKNHNNLEDVGTDLQNLYFVYAGITTFITLLVIFFFQEEPKLPPSETRELLKVNRIENKEGFIQPIKRLFKNKCFLLLCNSYGMNIGILNAIATLLNQIFLMHFPGGEEDAGRIGLLIILTGMIGSVTFGIIIDKTRKFKKTTVIAYFLTLCGQIIFTFTVSFEIKWMVYVAAIFLGFFMSGYFALGYEMCAEYTYPEPEFSTFGILNVANNLYGIAFILILGKFMEVYGDLAAHIGLCSALLAGFIMTIFTKDEQRRENARKVAQYRNIRTKDSHQLSHGLNASTIAETTKERLPPRK